VREISCVLDFDFWTQCAYQKLEPNSGQNSLCVFVLIILNFLTTFDDMMTPSSSRFLRWNAVFHLKARMFYLICSSMIFMLLGSRNVKQPGTIGLTKFVNSIWLIVFPYLYSMMFNVWQALHCFVC